MLTLPPACVVEAHAARRVLLAFSGFGVADISADQLVGKSLHWLWFYDDGRFGEPTLRNLYGRAANGCETNSDGQC